MHLAAHDVRLFAGAVFAILYFVFAQPEISPNVPGMAKLLWVPSGRP